MEVFDDRGDDGSEVTARPLESLVELGLASAFLGVEKGSSTIEVDAEVLDHGKSIETEVWIGKTGGLIPRQGRTRAGC